MNTTKTPAVIGVAAVVAAVVFLTSAPALAAAAGHGFPWSSWIVSILNLLVFIGIIYWFGGSAITAYYTNRRKALLADLEEAKRLREEAEARLEEYTARLEALEDERRELLDEYHEQGEREKKRIIEEAKKQVEKMRADAELTIEQEVKKAVATLEQQAVDLAVDLAEEMTRERLDRSQQSALVDDYVSDLDKMEAGRAA